MAWWAFVVCGAEEFDCGLTGSLKSLFDNNNNEISTGHFIGVMSCAQPVICVILFNPQSTPVE